MNKEVWICEDVGLVLKELREKLDDIIEHYHRLDEDRLDELDSDYYYIEEGLTIAKNILEEVAYNWSVPTDDVINRVKEGIKENEIKSMALNEKLDIIENFLWDLKDCPKHIQLVWNSILEEIGF